MAGVDGPVGSAGRPGPEASGTGAEYRVGALADAAGTTVRNIRVYQDRGLLPPPRRVGRIGLYSEEHLARLRLIGRLLDRGYTFATIGELFDAWSRGHDLADTLGLREVIAAPGSGVAPPRLTRRDLRRRFGRETTAATIDRAVELGLLVPSGTGYRAPSPRLLDAGAELVAAGAPLATVLDLAEALAEELQSVAERFFAVLSAAVAPPDGPEGPITQEQLARSVSRLRPHAQRALDALLATAMERAGDRLLARIAAAAQEPRADPGD